MNLYYLAYLTRYSSELYNQKRRLAFLLSLGRRDSGFMWAYGNSKTAPSIADTLAELLIDDVLTTQFHYFLTSASYLSY